MLRAPLRSEHDHIRSGLHIPPLGDRPGSAAQRWCANTRAHSVHRPASRSGSNLPCGGNQGELNGKKRSPRTNTQVSPSEGATACRGNRFWSHTTQNPDTGALQGVSTPRHQGLTRIDAQNVQMVACISHGATPDLGEPAPTRLSCCALPVRLKNTEAGGKLHCRFMITSRECRGAVSFRTAECMRGARVLKALLRRHRIGLSSRRQRSASSGNKNPLVPQGDRTTCSTEHTERAPREDAG